MTFPVGPNRLSVKPALFLYPAEEAKKTSQGATVTRGKTIVPLKLIKFYTNFFGLRSRSQAREAESPFMAARLRNSDPRRRFLAGICKRPLDLE
jgi:hypothetical protein